MEETTAYFYSSILMEKNMSFFGGAGFFWGSFSFERNLL